MNRPRELCTKLMGIAESSFVDPKIVKPFSHSKPTPHPAQEVSCFAMLTEGIVKGKDYVLVGGAWDSSSFQVTEVLFMIGLAICPTKTMQSYSMKVTIK